MPAPRTWPELVPTCIEASICSLSRKRAQRRQRSERASGQGNALSPIIPKEVFDRLPEKIRVPVAEAVAFSGPLPPPTLFGQYDQVLPGSAGRTMQVAENELAYRIACEGNCLEIAAGKVARGQSSDRTLLIPEVSTQWQTAAHIRARWCRVGLPDTWAARPQASPRLRTRTAGRTGLGAHSRSCQSAHRVANRYDLAVRRNWKMARRQPAGRLRRAAPKVLRPGHEEPCPAAVHGRAGFAPPCALAAGRPQLTPACDTSGIIRENSPFRHRDNPRIYRQKTAEFYTPM